LRPRIEYDPNGVYARNDCAAMLGRVVNLRQLGARAHLYDGHGEDLGFCHLPLPVEAGDLAAIEGATFRVAFVIDGTPGAPIDAVAVVEPMRLMAIG
jgi:hypothetical protein